MRRKSVESIVAQAHPKRRFGLDVNIDCLRGDEAFRRYFDAHLVRLLPASRRISESALLDLYRFVGCRPLAGLTSTDLEAWHAGLCSDLAAGSVATYVRRVKAFYRFCEQKGICKDPTRNLGYGSFEGSAPRPDELPTHDDLLRLKGVAGGPRYEAMIYTLFDSGARAGELLSMRLRDVELVEGGAILHLRESKTRTRKVFVSMCVPSLQTWLEHHPWKNNMDAPLWPVLSGPLRGRGVTYSGLAHMLDRCYRLAGIRKPARAHLFRIARVAELALVMNNAQLEAFFGWRQGRGARMRAIYCHAFGWQDSGVSCVETSGSCAETPRCAVLVVGGGIAGVQAALDLANVGVKVYLVERSPSIGGRMAQLDKTFPTDDCSSCILSPKMVEVARSPLINLLTLSEVERLEGHAGYFKAVVVRHPRYVDETKCTGCGVCAQKCPGKVPDEFNEGLSERRAIYIPFPQAVPLKYAIDAEHCRQLRGEKCGVCAKVCPAGAVDYEMKEQRLEIPVASVVVATGFDQLQPMVKEEYGFGRLADVVTSMQLERMLSASGPSGGKVFRPSDGEVPKRLVFVQCVGSRDVQVCEYCSRICCMSAIKEAQLALEHGVQKATVVSMDVRAFGKHFEGYYRRARERGVEFVHGRVSRVEGDGSGGLRVGVGHIPREEYLELPADLVVLSSAVIPSRGTPQLARVLGIELDGYGFFPERHINAYPTFSTRDGVFLAGCCQGPKDIPDTVVQASSAAAKAAALAFRSFAAAPQAAPAADDAAQPEPVDDAGEPRVGVFVCDCGSNIAGVVDVPSVVEHAKTLPGVAYAQESTFTCSETTQHEIQRAIREHRLNRVVVAACTPRTHEPIFQETLRRAGLNPYLFEMANIRDQCSWVHSREPEAATAKARDLVRMAVVRARLLQPLQPQQVPVTPRALVIGGGIAGIKAASRMAQMGLDVVLVEKRPFLGGRLTQLGEVFPEDTKGPEILQGIYQELLDQNVDARTKSEVVSVEGFVGNFKVQIRTRPRGVDALKCNLCGECEKVCPVDVESLFDRRLDTRKAIYYEPNTWPRVYNIDFDSCTLCGACVKACKRGAVRDVTLNPDLVEEDTVEAGAIVLSIGSDMYKPPDMMDYGMGKKSNVLSNIALERVLHPQGPTEGRLQVGGRSPRSVAFIQCVGSRDPLCMQLADRHGSAAESIGDCSRYCCQTTLKQAIQLRKLGVEVYILYTDIRAYEKGGERMYRAACERGVTFVKYDFDRKPAVEDLPHGGARVLVYDQLSQATLRLDVDLVVLVLGMTARYPDTPDLLKMFKVPQCGDGFCMEKHIKLAPLETNTEGIYIAGCLQAPQDIAETLSQGSGAAIKAAQILVKDKLLTSPVVAHVDREKCSGCRTCEKVCSYNAVQESGWANTMEINAALCKGCGACCASCPEEAIILDHFTTIQLLAQAIAGVEEGLS